MTIVWGSEFYGRTDRVPGVGHVETWFGHLWWIPLLPKGAHFIPEDTEETEDGWRGAPVGFSLKSVLLCWARLALGIVIAASALAMLASFDDPDGTVFVPSLAICIAACVAFWVVKWSKFCTRASYTRACALAEYIGLGEEDRIMLDLTYGQIQELEADRRLNAIQADGEGAFDDNPGFHDGTHEG